MALVYKWISQNATIGHGIKNDTEIFISAIREREGHCTQREHPPPFVYHGILA
jgi:hypothetical protein